MKQFKMALLTAAVLVLGGWSSASAQLAEGTSLSFSVPDSFVLNNRSFGPGEYSMARTPSSIDSPSLLMLRDGRGKGLMVFDTIAARSGKAASDSQLIFETFGGSYVLSRVWLKGQNAAYEVPRTRNQKYLMARSNRVLVVPVDTGF